MGNEYPVWTCRECAIKAGGKCDVCGEEKNVTEPRDYGYPNFEKGQYAK